MARLINQLTRKSVVKVPFSEKLGLCFAKGSLGDKICLMFSRDSYRTIGDYYTQPFSAIVEEETICNRIFRFELKGTFHMVDREKFIKYAMLEEVSHKVFMMHYIDKIYNEVMKDYFWVFDMDRGWSFPSLYKVLKKDNKISGIQRVHYYTEIDNNLKAIPYEDSGCVIDCGAIMILKRPYIEWIKERRNMVSDELRQYIEENYQYLEWREVICLSLQYDIEHKFQTKKYHIDGIEIETKILDNGLYIAWKNGHKMPGSLKMYRNIGGFSDNAIENNNGVLILDSSLKSGETIDYGLDKKKDYFYTVNYHPIGQLISQIFNLVRFNMRLPDSLPVSPKPLKTPIEEFEEREKTKLEQEVIRQKYKIQKEANRVRGIFEAERAKRAVFQEQEMKIHDEILGDRNWKDLSPKELQEMGRRLENLRDFMDSELDLE